MTSTALRPMAIDIPQAKLDRIRAKLADMQWPEAPVDDGDWRYGVDLKYLRELVDYWVTGYDWRKAESELNRYPHFKAMVDDTDIHFVHVRGSGARPFPLILTHGWPGSFHEYYQLTSHFAFPGLQKKFSAPLDLFMLPS